MIRIEIDTVIARPVEQVFDRLANIDGYPQWLPKSRVFLHTRQTVAVLKRSLEASTAQAQPTI
jgi:uncharacterized protein YndB with AHSA1/START domain